MASTVSIIIPTHNRARLLTQLLDTVSGLIGIGPGDEVVVVANACSDDTVARIAHRAADAPLPVRIVEEPRANLNVARNAGAAHACGDILAYVDDDVLLPEGWLEALRSNFDAHGADVGTGPIELHWNEVARPEWLTPRAAKLLTCIDLGPEARRTRDGSHFAGANLAIRARVLQEIGGFVEGLDRTGTDLISGGDTELVRRAFAAGFEGYYEPGARVRHQVTPERATREYINRVARGRGRTRVALANVAGSPNSATLARVGIAQCLTGAAWQVRGWLTRDVQRRVDGAIIAARGRGTVTALLGSGK